MVSDSIYYSEEVNKLWYNKLKADKYFAPIGLSLFIILQIYTFLVYYFADGDAEIYLKSIPQMVLWILMLTLLWWQVPKLTRKMDESLISLKNSCSTENYDKFRKNAIKIVSHWANSLLLAFFAIFIILLSHEIIPFINEGVDSFNRYLLLWTGVDSAVLGIPHHFIDLVQLFFVISFYGVIFNRIVNFIIISIISSKYLDKVNIYHEDRSAGLGEIGKFIYYFLKVATVLIFLLVGFALSWYTLDVKDVFWRDLFIKFSIPVIVFLCVFFIPQITIRNLILEEKSKRRKSISYVLQDLDKLLLGKTSDDIDYQKVQERVETIQAFQKAISFIPNWPFKLDQLIKVLLAAFTPLITVIISYILESVLNP